MRDTEGRPGSVCKEKDKQSISRFVHLFRSGDLTGSTETTTGEHKLYERYPMRMRIYPLFVDRAFHAQVEYNLESSHRSWSLIVPYLLWFPPRMTHLV